MFFHVFSPEFWSPDSWDASLRNIQKVDACWESDLYGPINLYKSSLLISSINLATLTLVTLFQLPRRWLQAINDLGQLKYGAFHSHGGTPIAGWCLLEKIPSFEMDDDWGYPYDSGNLHMSLTCNETIRGFPRSDSHHAKGWEQASVGRKCPTGFEISTKLSSSARVFCCTKVRKIRNFGHHLSTWYLSHEPHQSSTAKKKAFPSLEGLPSPLPEPPGSIKGMKWAQIWTMPIVVDHVFFYVFFKPLLWWFWSTENKKNRVVVLVETWW